MPSYRAFVSYSHEDKDLAKAVVDALELNGLTPLWDEHLALGRVFDSQIKNLIACAHVFVPLITASSNSRGWVHQEIGYAMALRVPVLPVCQGYLPGEMLQMLQAINLGDDQAAFRTKLSREVFDDLVSHTAGEARPLYECAMLPEDRSTLLAQYSDQVREVRIRGRSAHGCVRQKAALGSFCLPNKHLAHPIWQIREGRLPRSAHRRECLLKERKSLEKHAQEEGCRLILNPWLDNDQQYGPGATYARLKTLVEFLEWERLPGDKVEVALRSSDRPHSLTIVGDWFLAETVAATLGAGYQQTMFTRHAPTVRSRLEAFDQEFFELLEESGIRPSGSKAVAINILNERLSQLPRPELK